MSTNNTNTNDFINTVGDWFAKFPPLPKTWCETLVKITPVLALIFGILGILVAIGGLGIFTVFSPVAFLGGAQEVGFGFLSALIYLVGSVLLLAAYPGTNAKKYKG